MPPIPIIPGCYIPIIGGCIMPPPIIGYYIPIPPIIGGCIPIMPGCIIPIPPKPIMFIAGIICCMGTMPTWCWKPVDT